jgi:O-antigen ligase
LRSAAGIWKAYFIEPALFAVVVLDLSIERKSLTWLINSLLFSGLWLSLLAIWQVLSGTNQFAPYAISLGRATAVYTTPNALGLYLGPLTFLALGFLFELYKQKQINLKKFGLPWYLIICLLAFSTAIILSKSRGAGLGIVSSVVVFFLLVSYQRVSAFWQKLFKYGALITVVAYFVLNIFVFVKIDRFVATYKPTTQDSIEARFCIWQATKKMLADRPITGAGLSAYQKIYPSYATCYSEAHLYPHNILLNFWTEIGIVGLLAFIWLAFTYWRILSGFLKNFISVGLISAMIYIFIHGLVDVPYFKNDLASEFWVMLAMAVWFGTAKVGKR